MKTIWPLFIFIEVILVAFPSQARVVEKIVAIVNDEIITQTDLQKFRNKLASNGLMDEAILRLVNKKTLLKDYKSLINHLINEKLLDSEVKRKGLSVTIERVEREIRSITRRNKVSRKQLKTALKKKNVTYSEYQNFIRISLERQALIEKEISSKIKISEDDINSYYVSQMGDKNANVFEYTLAHILFKIKKDEKEARKRAQLVKDKLKSGSNSFAKLALQFSEDPNFSQGGVLGTFKSGEMLPTMEKSVLKLKEGDTTDIIKTRIGLHLVKLIKKNLVPNSAYESKKEAISNILFMKAFEKQLRSWIDNRRQNSFIRIN